jgi:hypothetical protein
MNGGGYPKSRRGSSDAVTLQARAGFSNASTDLVAGCRGATFSSRLFAEAAGSGLSGLVGAVRARIRLFGGFIREVADIVQSLAERHQ